MEDDILKITLYRIQEKDVENINSDLPGLDLLKQYHVLSTSRYMDLANVSERTARRRLSELVKAGKAKKVGDGPSTEYVIVE